MNHHPDVVIEVCELDHAYGSKIVYQGLNLQLLRGSVFGLLGKNGVGKSTLIKILMGFLAPQKGVCRVLGEASHDLKPATRERIALLFEGFISYDWMTIAQIERFFSAFYPRWRKQIFYELMSQMDVELQRKLTDLSCGQKSQVILGLLLAQDAELLILDDYSMGLDAGYRALFIDFLKDYLEGTDKTVLITSHVMSDLERLVDQMTIVAGPEQVHHSTMTDFCRDFRCYQADCPPSASSRIHRCEQRQGHYYLFSFADQKLLEQELSQPLKEVSISFEDKFLGFAGKY